MAVTQSVRDQLFDRSGGRCECRLDHTGKTNVPHHGGRCPTTFRRNGNWEAHHKTSVSAGGSDALSNLLALCPSCHQATRTYGR